MSEKFAKIPIKQETRDPFLDKGYVNKCQDMQDEEPDSEEVR